MFRENLVEVPKSALVKADTKPMRLTKRRRLRRLQNGIDTSAIKSTWF